MVRYVLACVGVMSFLAAGEVRGDGIAPFGSTPTPETYLKAGNVTGEIIEISKAGQLTLRVKWMKPEVQRNQNNNNRNRGRNRGRGNNNNRNRNRPTIKMVEQTSEVKVTLIPSVRVKSQIPLSGSGEKNALTGADLKEGHIIAAVLVRARSNPKQLSIHTAMILGHGKGGGKESGKKKK